MTRSVEDSEKFKDFAEHLVRLSSTVLPAAENHSGFAFETKEDFSPVTVWDREIELKMREAISRQFPSHGILGEEFPAVNSDSDYQWILDPIDGTEEFVFGLPHFGSIAALYYKSEAIAGAIYHPAIQRGVSAAAGCGLKIISSIPHVRHEPTSACFKPYRIACSSPREFFRQADTRAFFPVFSERFDNLRMHRCCYSYTLALLGMVDACVDVNVHLWDMAPLKILAEEADLDFLDFSLSPDPLARESRRIVFGRKEVVDEIVTLLNEQGLLR